MASIGRRIIPWLNGMTAAVRRTAKRCRSKERAAGHYLEERTHPRAEVTFLILQHKIRVCRMRIPLILLKVHDEIFSWKRVRIL